MNSVWQIDSVRPPTRFVEEVQGMLNSMDAFELSGVNYIACPITGGFLYLDHIRSVQNDLVISDASSLIVENIELAYRFSSRVRERTGQVCINPAVLHRKHWTQDDYRHFWSRVIERFAGQMYLSRGWEVSSGCLFECLLAIRLELPLFNHELERLEYAEAIELAQSGIATLIEAGESSRFLKVLADEFQELNNSELINGRT